MPQFVGQLLHPQPENSSNEPPSKNYQAELHASRLAQQSAQVEETSRQAADDNEGGSDSFSPPTGDDYEINTPSFAESDDDDDDGSEESDFSSGYNSAAGDGSFLRERLVSWAAGVFSPPGTGPMFGSGASLIQWIFRDEIDSTTESNKE